MQKAPQLNSLMEIDVSLGDNENHREANSIEKDSVEVISGETEAVEVERGTISTMKFQIDATENSSIAVKVAKLEVKTEIRPEVIKMDFAEGSAGEDGVVEVTVNTGTGANTSNVITGNREPDKVDDSANGGTLGLACVSAEEAKLYPVGENIYASSLVEKKSYTCTELAEVATIAGTVGLPNIAEDNFSQSQQGLKKSAEDTGINAEFAEHISIREGSKTVKTNGDTNKFNQRATDSANTNDCIDELTSSDPKKEQSATNPRSLKKQKKKESLKRKEWEPRATRSTRRSGRLLTVQPPVENIDEGSAQQPETAMLPEVLEGMALQINNAKKRKIRGLEKLAKGQYLGEGIWPVAGRKIFPTIGNLPPNGMLNRVEFLCSFFALHDILTHFTSL
jgi:hypothetical protein